MFHVAGIVDDATDVAGPAELLHYVHYARQQPIYFSFLGQPALDGDGPRAQRLAFLHQCRERRRHAVILIMQRQVPTPLRQRQRNGAADRTGGVGDKGNGWDNWCRHIHLRKLMFANSGVQIYARVRGCYLIIIAERDSRRVARHLFALFQLLRLLSAWRYLLQ
ncbi:MAG: hypothetical protein NVS3B11_20390 [Collimonas sp.]